MTGRGMIVPIGGAEEKMRDPAILSRFVDHCGCQDGRIVVIPTASSLKSTGRNYITILRRLGVKHIKVLPFETREDCFRADWLAVLEAADGVFLTGGNQLKLSTTLGGTPVTAMLRRRNAHEGLHVAGTSAGAAVLGEHMIAFGNEGSTPRADMVTLAPGFGLTNLAIIDQHFRQRDRLGRLLTALAYNPEPVGIGLDEDTAAFIDADDILTVAGSGAITVVDPSTMTYSSMDSAKRHSPVCVLDIRVHVLVDGARFDLRGRTAVPPPPPPPRGPSRPRARSKP